MKISFLGRIMASLPWRIQSRLRVVTDLQEWLSIPWLSDRVASVVQVRPAVAENYGKFPISTRWARIGGGFEPRYTYQLKNADVDIATGLVSLDGWTLAESVGDHLNAGTTAFTWRIVRRLAKCFGRVEKLTGGASYTYLKADGYFHFVMECLVQLLYSLRSFPDTCVLLNAAEYKGFYRGYVDLLQKRGFIKDIKLVVRPVVSATDYIMTAAEEDAGMFCGETIQLLREVLLKGVSDIKATRRVFLTRKGRRRFENQEQLEAIATRSGFEVLDTDGMGISEEIDLFRSCSCIIANHGAGLTNLIYGNKGAKVVELFSPKWFNDCYFRLSSLMNMEYKCLVADDSGQWGKINEAEFQRSLISL